MKRQNDSKPVPEQTELQRQVESLQRNIRRLQLEHDLLKKANEGRTTFDEAGMFGRHH